VADSAFNLNANDFELSAMSKSRRKLCESFSDGVELRAALAANGDGNRVHS